MVRVNLRAELERLLGPRADVTAVGTLAVDETILRLVVQEVGTNAMKYSPNNERIRVEANLLEGTQARCPPTVWSFSLALSCAVLHLPQLIS